MRKFLILLLILVILLVAADRISVYVAQRKVASRLAGAYNLSTPPSVTIQGFPFLTQVVAGRYDQVDVTLSSVTAGGVEMRDLRARFTGVHAPLVRLLGNGSAQCERRRRHRDRADPVRLGAAPAAVRDHARR